MDDLFIFTFLVSIIACIFSLSYAVFDRSRRRSALRALGVSVIVLIASPILAAIFQNTRQNAPAQLAASAPEVNAPHNIDAPSLGPTGKDRRPLARPVKISEAANRATQEETRKNDEQALLATGKHCFSAWDGSHILFTRMLKQSLRNPGSYEHVSTKFGKNDQKDRFITLVVTYRAENGFGGMNVEQAVATFEPTTCVVITAENVR